MNQQLHQSLTLHNHQPTNNQHHYNNQANYYQPSVETSRHISPMNIEIQPEENSKEKEEICSFVILFVIYLLMQTPFTTANLYYAYNEPYSVCMDEGSTGLIVRNWFRGVGIT